MAGSGRIHGVDLTPGATTSADSAADRIRVVTLAAEAAEAADRPTDAWADVIASFADDPDPTVNRVVNVAHIRHAQALAADGHRADACAELEAVAATCVGDRERVDLWKGAMDAHVVIGPDPAGDLSQIFTTLAAQGEPVGLLVEAADTWLRWVRTHHGEEAALTQAAELLTHHPTGVACGAVRLARAGLHMQAARFDDAIADLDPLADGEAETDPPTLKATAMARRSFVWQALEDFDAAATGYASTISTYAASTDPFIVGVVAWCLAAQALLRSGTAAPSAALRDIALAFTHLRSSPIAFCRGEMLTALAEIALQAATVLANRGEASFALAGYDAISAWLAEDPLRAHEPDRVQVSAALEQGIAAALAAASEALGPQNRTQSRPRLSDLRFPLGLAEALDDQPMPGLATPAEARYAQGVDEYRAGDTLMAGHAWWDAARLGSATAFFVLGIVDPHTEGEDIWGEAEAAGSAFAALARIAARGPEDDYDVVSAVLRKAGYPEATDPAADVASVLGKAAADALRDANRGSAGAAYLLAVIAHFEGRPMDAHRMLQRADALGSATAAMVLGWYEEAEGMDSRALMAHLRAVGRGSGPGTLAYAGFIDRLGHRRGARRLRREALRLAVASRDDVSYLAIDRAVHPPVTQSIREHPVIAAAVAAAMIGVGVWRWKILLVVVVIVIAIRAWRRIPQVGAPVVPEGGPGKPGDEVTAGPLSMSVNAVPFATLLPDQAPVRGHWTATGRRLQFAGVALLVAFALAVAVDAGGFGPSNLTLRAALILAAVTRVWPIMARGAVQETYAPRVASDALSVTAGVGFGPNLSLGLRVGITGQRLPLLLAEVANTESSDRLTHWRSAASSIAMASLLIAAAVGWVRAEDAQSQVGAGFEIAACACLAGLAIYRIGRGWARRSAGFVLMGTAQILALIVLIALAARFGLLESWTSLWETVEASFT